tara:strand:+ start:179 stop:1486 length:1308 start_codon:yes stop_codon:yes gene_type:complete
MANIIFQVKTKKNPSSIYVRFYHSNQFDLNARTGFLIDSNLWSNKQQRVKTTTQNIFDKIINPKLSSLRETILLRYNEDFMLGKSIDTNWLNQLISEFNNQPLQESDNIKYFFAPYFEKFIKDSKTRINVLSGRPIDPKTISKYKTTLKLIREFEELTTTKLRFQDIDLQFHKNFIAYLTNDLYFNGSTSQKHLEIIKGICREARIEGIEVNSEFEHKKFIIKRNKTYDTYLNNEEIQTIFNLDFSYNDRLDNVRDWLIIGVRTGLRISDISRLSNINIQEDKISIKNKKTPTFVTIPLHSQVKKILNKRDGSLPRKISEAKFNKYVKEVVSEAEITEKIYGSKKALIITAKNEKIYRKIEGYYKKYELISSHTCRRSFVSNLYGELPNRTIMEITGHQSEVQFEKYVKQTSKEHFEKLQKYWEAEEAEAQEKAL